MSEYPYPPIDPLDDLPTKLPEGSEPGVPAGFEFKYFPLPLPIGSFERDEATLDAGQED